MGAIYESLLAMKKTVGAIYDTLSAIAGFIQSLTAWFGFGPLLALFFLLFFFKIYQSVFGAGRRLGFAFAFVTLTALWLTWNMSYYQDYKIYDIIRIYGILFLNLLAVYALYRLLSWIGNSIYQKYRARRKHPATTLEIYHKIDSGVSRAKEYILARDHVSAAKVMEELQGYLLLTPAKITPPEGKKGENLHDGV